MRVKITLTPQALFSCLETRARRGMETPEDFEGPDFDKVDSADFVGKFLEVSLSCGTRYYYPEDSIARIAVYPDVVNLQPESPAHYDDGIPF